MTATAKQTLFLLITFLVILVWSGINPHDRFTWFLEVAPALIGLVIMALTYRSFPLTPLLYWLIWVHAIILVVGGHYTYARVPLFDWIKEVFNQSRNNYDKLGHFAQGFVPAILAREILLRKKVVTRPGWLIFLVLCVCLAFSAFYELLEWLAAVFSGEAAEDFLGTQGYQWDTQTDMALALVGAAVALALLSRWHDRQLARLESDPPRNGSSS